MEHSQKMVVTPIENEQPPSLLPVSQDVLYSSGLPTQTSSTSTQFPVKKQKAHPFLEKLTNQLKIILKLAKIDAYDNTFRIKNDKGFFIENSNIINLLQNATLSSKILVGQDAFITLLFKAKVDPELIKNENVKQMLIRLYEKQTKTSDEEPVIYSKSPPVIDMDTTPVIKSRKRTLTRDEEEESDKPEPKRKSNWIIPENVEQETIEENQNE
jgi:hypothetical protein